MQYYVYLLLSNLQHKKYKVIKKDQNKKKIKSIHFGDRRYEDNTIHNNDKRKENYIKRHMKNESFEDSLSKGFWALNILWNKKNIKYSKSDLEKSILQTRNLAGRNEFLLFAQRGFILMKEAIKFKNPIGDIPSDETDKQNFLLLKKYLGMERQELMLKQLMTKNNENNIQDIANNFNKQKYDLVVKDNDMISTWLKQPNYVSSAVANTFKNNIIDTTTLDAYTVDDSQPTGIPYDIIFDKVKKVLSFLSNLFMELIENKFPTGTSVQVSEYQDLQQRLDQAQLLGKVKKQNKMVKKNKK